MNDGQDREPTLGGVINFAIERALEGVHTAIPGSVVRYDPATQIADIKPLIPQAYLDEEGERQVQSLPVIPNCPVQFPGGRGLTIVFPLAVGDIGLCVFSQASLDRWISGSGDEVADPGFDHRHAITDAIFIPGVRTSAAPRSTDPGDAICIGMDGGSFQGAGLGATIQSVLDSIVTKYNLHQHTSAGASPPTQLITVPLPGVESGTVKVTP